MPDQRASTPHRRDTRGHAKVDELPPPGPPGRCEACAMLTEIRTDRGLPSIEPGGGSLSDTFRPTTKTVVFGQGQKRRRT